jgi:hypothetical protein
MYTKYPGNQTCSTQDQEGVCRYVGMGMNGTAGTKNYTDSTLLSCIINRMIGRGHGHVLVPVDIMVNDLETTHMGLEVMMMNSTYQKQSESLFQ